MDTEKIEKGVKLILEGIGEDPNREGLLETPARVARMYEEICAGMAQNPHDFFKTTFDEDHQEMILLRDIPFFSTCEHHMVPFFGHAHVAYVPGEDGRICGLSKISRLIDVYARRLQVQERLTSEIADTLMEELGALGVIVILEAEHMCMTIRGIRKPGITTTTSAVRGVFKSSHRTRSEALSLIYPGK